MKSDVLEMNSKFLSHCKLYGRDALLIEVAFDLFNKMTTKKNIMAQNNTLL